MSKTIICPNQNCGYQGPATVKSKKEVAGGAGCMIIGLLAGLLAMQFLITVGIITAAFGVACGLFYTFCHGQIYTCPRCGLEISRD